MAEYKYGLNPETVKKYLKVMEISRIELARRAGITLHKVKGFLDRDSASEKTRDAIANVFNSIDVTNMDKLVSMKYECNPPHSCFTCPYPDCKNGSLVSRQETEFSKAGFEKDWVGDGTVYNPKSQPFPFRYGGIAIYK